MTESGFEGMSAHETTQWLSGELFTYIDALISDNYQSDDEIIFPKIDRFIKAVLRLITMWLVKIPQMTKTLEEMEAVAMLYLVDSRAAIVEAAPELMETLGKLFGSCMRALHYFSFYDCNQIDPNEIIAEVETTAIIPNTFGVVV